MESFTSQLLSLYHIFLYIYYITTSLMFPANFALYQHSWQIFRKLSYGNWYQWKGLDFGYYSSNKESHMVVCMHKANENSPTHLQLHDVKKSQIFLLSSKSPGEVLSWFNYWQNTRTGMPVVTA